MSKKTIKKIGFLVVPLLLFVTLFAFVDSTSAHGRYRTMHYYGSPYYYSYPYYNYYYPYYYNYYYPYYYYRHYRY